MLHNPNISQSMDTITKYSDSAAAAVLSDVNAKLAESIAAFDNAAAVATATYENLASMGYGFSSEGGRPLAGAMSVADRSIVWVKATADSMLTAGFGTGIVIASGISTSAPEVQQLDELFKSCIKGEEMLRARLKGIKRINETTKTVDVQAEVPNWSKTVGATLPAWSDAGSKQNLAVLMCDKIKKSIQEFGQFKKAGVTPAGGIADLLSTNMQTEFLVGVLEGLMYAKKADFGAMTHQYLLKSKDGGMDKVSLPDFFKKAKGALVSNDVTGMIAVAATKK